MSSTLPLLFTVASAQRAQADGKTWAGKHGAVGTQRVLKDNETVIEELARASPSEVSP